MRCRVWAGWMISATTPSPTARSMPLGGLFVSGDEAGVERAAVLGGGGAPGRGRKV